jgi:NADPH:quinone reductase-like Zn-dependent oxidoreductase
MAATDAARMQALRAYARDDPAGLRYEETDVPAPGIGDVLLRVAVASFTPTELGWPSTWVDRAGRDRTPAIPGHEVSGTVVALGYGTTGLAVGDRAFGLTDWYRDAAAAQFVAVEARNLALTPGSVSDPQAGAVPLAGLTAWQALFVHGSLMPGQTVIINAASGGVGTLAVQLARAASIRVIGMARARARNLVLELGADVFVDVDSPQMEESLGDVDVVFDLVGGELMKRCSSMVRPGGVVVSAVESPAGPDPERYPYRSVFFVVEPDRGQLEELGRRLEAGSLRPIIGQQVALRDGARAFSAKQAGGIPGKIVLTPP